MCPKFLHANSEYSDQTTGPKVDWTEEEIRCIFDDFLMITG